MYYKHEQLEGEEIPWWSLKEPPCVQTQENQVKYKSDPPLWYQCLTPLGSSADKGGLTGVVCSRISNQEDPGGD